MHLILTGATGLVGSGVLDAMVRAPGITKISILSRRPVPQAQALADPRINVIIHGDFGAYDDAALLRQLHGAEGCVWALGISQNKVGSVAEYERITRDYALAAAQAFSRLAADSGASSRSGGAKQPFRFVYVSGEGATHTPGRFSATFARVKGATEQALAALADSSPALQAVSVRPAFVDASQHAAIGPYVPDPGMLMRATVALVGPPVRAFYRSFHSPTDVLGRFLVDVAAGRVDHGRLQGAGAFRVGDKSSSWVVGNVGMRRIMGL